MTRHGLLGIALLLAGSALLVKYWAATGDTLRPLGICGGWLLNAIGLLTVLTAISRPSRSSAWLRLDHFLPFLRKRKQREAPQVAGWWYRLAQGVLPSRWFSDPVTGKPGAYRRLLKRLGPSVLSSPVRRVVQAVCLLLFLWLFFYVCWPYSAQPQSPGAVSRGWLVESIDPQTGNVHLVAGTDDRAVVQTDGTLHLVDTQALDAIRGYLATLHVVSRDHSQVVLSAPSPLSDDQLDALVTRVGPWDLHQHSPWPRHYTDDLADKEWLPAELFLVIDPLVSLSTAIAARSWVFSLTSAAVILLVCVLIPRGFCGYLCPLGTVIDLFDWLIGKRIKRFQVADDGWWVHIKYYLLAGTLVCALGGVLVTGFVAAIPVITRGLLFFADPLQSGVMRGFNQLPPINTGHILSMVLFAAVLGLGLLKPRFWCKYVCPSGAVFSLGNLLRISQRKVESSCIHCNKCVEICPFDAIKPDFTTRTSDCTLCQTCAGVCPTQAIKFVERWNLVELKVPNDPPTRETVIGRRGFVSLAAGTAAALAGGIGTAAVTRAFGAGLDADPDWLPVRPPGSVPEQQFLQMCIRCGECFKVCPYNVLQPMGFEQGLEGLWTPQVVADHAGCASSCNACGQVCPTGAIRALPLEEKRVARMGLAIVNQTTCLPIAGREACQLCVDECNAAGYHAIEFTRMHTEVDAQGQPIADSGFLAPVVLEDKCVGCGLCQMACYRVNVNQKQLLDESAIVVEAGEGKEDRLMRGSYRELRRQEARQRRQQADTGGSYFIPDPSDGDEPGQPDSPFGQPPPARPSSDDPFGIGPG